MKTHHPTISRLGYILSLIILTNNAHQQAVICVPVADLVGQSIKSIYPNLSTDNAYNALPMCPGQKNAGYACPRLHQLLYNDVVTIIKQTDDETCIQTSHAFYITPTSSTPQSIYWTATKNIRTFDDLARNKHINLDYIPQPIQFNDPDNTALLDDLVETLIIPHYDPVTRLTFSAGTRFVRTPKQKNLRAKKINVFAIDYQKNKMMRIAIPAHKLINQSLLKTPENQIHQYVHLIKEWAHQKQGFIPYVWGGNSFTTTIHTPFKEVTKKNNTHEYSWYEFDADSTTPKNGFDCSGLIARATQICGIPYFCKNTTTIANYLQPLQPDDTLMNGDLILIKGHVMVVSDIANNLLIEARGYTHGYGKLHEVPLKKVFDGIKTYQQLCDAFFNKKALKRKDSNGKIRDSFNDWKILKIMSVYK
jgi:cell wall-associated NlpC family hydrolase